MRPQLKPALARIWRDPVTLQLGIDPAHAVMLGGIELTDSGLLELLDGTRDLQEITRAAKALGHSSERVRALITALQDAAAIDEAPPSGQAADPRRQPDLLALSLLYRAPGAAAQVMAGRGQAGVEILGAGRVGASIAMLLSAAGIGQLDVTDPGPVRQADVSPGGIRRVGSRHGTRAEALRAQLASGLVSTTYAPVPSRGDTTVVLAPTGSIVPPEWLGQVRHRPHLPVVIRETTAIIGPFVLRGQTPCMRCVELARGDRDPAWPALAAQLIGERHVVESSDITLASAAASLAAMHLLAWLDRGIDSALPSIGGTVELSLADLRLRRRTVTAHPGCGCGATEAIPLSPATS